MRITVFTGDQPRHFSLVNMLELAGFEVFCVSEETQSFEQLSNSDNEVIANYFSLVSESERQIFPDGKTLSENASVIDMGRGGLSDYDFRHHRPFLESDFFCVFGSSYIKEPLLSFLLEKRAINLHAGISPYYRGSACNFWALYDDNPHLVGATIHLLARKIDGGDILMHALPSMPTRVAKLDLGMIGVRAGQEGLSHLLRNVGGIADLVGEEQDDDRLIRYSRLADFNQQVVEKFMSEDLGCYKSFDYPPMVHPFFLELP